MSTPETELPSPAAAISGDSPLDARLAGLNARTMRQIRDAREAIDKRDARSADAHLERARPVAGEHPEFLRLAGIVRQMQGRAPEAVVALRRALEKAPGDALVLMNLGTALRAAGDIDAAIVTLRRATEVAPKLAAAWYNLGRTLGPAGQTSDAHDAYARALERDPAHVKARIGYADTLRVMGRIDDRGGRVPRSRARPGGHQASLRLANMQTVKFSAEETTALERQFASPGTSESDRVVVGFALAKALEDQNRYSEAFTVLSSANAIKRRSVQWVRTHSARASIR